MKTRELDGAEKRRRNELRVFQHLVNLNKGYSIERNTKRMRPSFKEKMVYHLYHKGKPITCVIIPLEFDRYFEWRK